LGWAIVSFIAGKVAAALDIPMLATIASIASCISMDVASCAGGGFGASYGLTGDLGQAFKAGAIAAVSTWAFNQVGQYFNAGSAGNNPGAYGLQGPTVPNLVKFGGNYLTRVQVAAQISAHAIVGGVMSVLQGGKFGHGFAAAGVVSGSTNLLKAASVKGGRIGGTIAAATVGGTASKITGGKFSNGAQTGAFQFLYGELSGSQQEEGVPDWHKNRNDNQQCPATCADLDKNQYWEEGQAPLHGGDKGYFTYRGDSSLTKGNQCVYAAQCSGVNSVDQSIRRIDNPVYAGTYDYIPPTKIGNTNIWNPVTVTGHFLVDVLPYKLWGN